MNVSPEDRLSPIDDFIDIGRYQDTFGTRYENVDGGHTTIYPSYLGGGPSYSLTRFQVSFPGALISFNGANWNRFFFRESSDPLIKTIQSSVARLSDLAKHEDFDGHVLLSTKVNITTRELFKKRLGHPNHPDRLNIKAYVEMNYIAKNPKTNTVIYATGNTYIENDGSQTTSLTLNNPIKIKDLP